MDRRKFLHITWINFLRPLLFIAAIYLVWKIWNFFSSDTSSTITINYPGLLKAILLFIAVIVIAAIVLLGVSWLIKKMIKKLSVEAQVFLKKYNKAITTILYLSIGVTLFFVSDRNLTVVYIFLAYGIFRTWFPKKEAESKNQYS